MKLALAMISEGNHPNLKRAVESVYKYVDHIFITTTKIKPPQWEDPKITWSFYKWDDDFSNARNFNWSQVPEDYRYVLWLDSDDIIKNAKILPQIVDQMEENQLDAVFVDYNYDINEAGQVLIVHPRERIVRKDTYTWKGKLHETLIPKRKTRHIYGKDFTVDHYPTKENKDTGLLRNLKILQKDYEDQRKRLVKGDIEEIDPRTEYYLGRVLYDTKTNTGLKRAFQLFQDYLEHSGWDEERAFAWNYLGNIEYHFQKYDEAVVCYLSAIKERPEFPTWHINLARCYAAMKDWDKAEHHLKVGLSMDQPKTSTILTPLEDKKTALLVAFFVSFAKYEFSKAIKTADMLYQIEPNKENRDRLESVRKLKQMTRWSKAVGEMVEDMAKRREYNQAHKLLESLPDDISNTAYIDTLKTTYMPPKVWPKKSVVYYAAIDVHSWSPKDVKKGMGGSEEAILNLSREWVKLGYTVTVYTNVGSDEGVYEGVEYKNFQRFNNKDQFDILISWRNPHFILKNLLDARLILLDLHDVPEPGEFDQDLLNRVDYIMVKSQYHRSLLPEVPDNKFIVINNGINYDYLQSFTQPKRRYTAFYGSSYDRGLENLLEIWPEVIREIPEAQLHICYGWDLFDKLRGHVKTFRDWKAKIESMMNHPSIIHHGKVGKEELYQIARQATVWAYPTNFQEIDCITARYCQALETLPCVYTYAALETTVQRGVRLAVDPHKRESLKAYKEELIKALKDTPQEDYSFTRDWDWSNVAKEWVKVFELPFPQTTKVTVFTPTIRSGFWNSMADNLSLQSYQNFEWLVVDDYPEDRESIALKYGKQYGIKVRYLRGKKKESKYNYSLIQADNQAILAAKGSLIVWLQDFIYLPEWGLERIVRLHRRYPNCLLAPVDEYYSMKQKPDLDNKLDWFNGNTDIIGKFLRKNIRIDKGELRVTDNAFDFEMNIGAIPTAIARKLNGLWEFQDDGLGFNNTEIAYRAQKLGYQILVDERLRAKCLDLWEYLAGHEENAKDREYNLNDARFRFLVWMTDKGYLPIIRDEAIDKRIKLDTPIPEGLNQKEASDWMQNNASKVARKLIEEWKEKL